ncbi:MAG: hypothetical protein FJ138_10770 [Deltaproteobacteria bacterium]|nr:hypothetical protein [Deltaproteobacteria bacterium]
MAAGRVHEVEAHRLLRGHLEVEVGLPGGIKIGAGGEGLRHAHLAREGGEGRGDARRRARGARRARRRGRQREGGEGGQGGQESGGRHA